MSTPAVEANYKTVTCRHFEQHGHCRYGDKCSYAHGPAELRTNTGSAGRQGGSKRNHHNNNNGQQSQPSLNGMPNMNQQMQQPGQMGGSGKLSGDMTNMNGGSSHGQFSGNNVGGQMMMQPGGMGAFGGQHMFMDPSALNMQMLLQQ